jgi:hypothetical protein
MKRSAGTYRPMTPAQMVELQSKVANRDGYCFFADGRHHINHRCSGRQWAGHLYPQSKLKNEAGFRDGAWKMPDDAFWRPLNRYTPRREGMVTLTLGEICGIAENAVAICDGFHKPFDDEVDIRRQAFDLLERYDDGSGPDFKRFYRMFQLEAQVERHFGLKPFTLDAS